METIKIWPYAKLIIKSEPITYRIMRFNTNPEIGDWELLEGIYTTLDSVKKAIDDYNREAGMIEIKLEI